MDDEIAREPVSPLTALLGVARNMFPENIALAAVNMNILGIITFSLMFGLALAATGEIGEPLVAAVDVSFLHFPVAQRKFLAFRCSMNKEGPRLQISRPCSDCSIGKCSCYLFHIDCGFLSRQLQHICSS